MEISDLDPDPLRQVQRWMDAARAAGAPVPGAMALATTTAAGHPAARMVLLRDIDAGLVFCTDDTSDKAEQLALSGRAAAVLYWQLPIARQVRITGTAEGASAEDADRLWADRTRAVKLSALASWQSRPVASRAELERQVGELNARFPDGTEVPRPERWRAFRVVPDTVEFWEEAPDALHDRIRFQRATTGAAPWTAERLYP